MSVAGPIRSLLQQQDKALYQVKQKIKEQGAKQVSKVKEKLPTPDEIKEKFTPKASTATCNINGLKKSEKNYNKFKKILSQLKKIVEGAKKALSKIKEICDKIMSAIEKILGICAKIAALVGVLSAVVSVSKVILKGLGAVKMFGTPGGVLLAPGTAVFLKDKLDAASGLVQMIKATISAIPKLLERYTSKALKYIGYIAAAIAALVAIKNIINFIIGLLETLFLGQLSSCGAFNSSDDPTDSDGNINTNNNGAPSGNVANIEGTPGLGNPGWVLTSNGNNNISIPPPGLSIPPTGIPPSPSSPYVATNGDTWQFNSGNQTASDFLSSIGYNQQTILDGADPFDFSDDLSDYYESQLNSLRNQGNDEIIERIYNANFQMLGYRRYKV